MISPFLMAGAAFALFVAIVVLRALAFRPDRIVATDTPAPQFSAKELASRLSRIIQLATVSSRDDSQVDWEAFERFRSLIESLYPKVSSTCERHLVGRSGVVYRLKGQRSDNPTVLMAHYDVVSADSEGWIHPPFSGEIDGEGVLWGRGAIDTKITVCAILEALERHLEEGFVPAHDLFLSFSGDEEIMGPSAPAIVSWMEGKGIKPALVLDEGGAVVTNVFPGVSKPCAVVGISEKGVLDIEFSVEAAGGHASAPPVRQPVVSLARAIDKMDANPFSSRLTPASRMMFDALGRHSTFGFKILFANLWCFLPVLQLVCTLTGGELAALMHTTVCFTILGGSDAYNVMPLAARSGANCRLLQGDTADSAFARLESLAKSEGVSARQVYAFDPSPVSDCSGPGWSRIQHAISATWPDAVIAPYLMVACTDSRHFSRICRNVYRFSAMALSKEERSTMHARNERIPIEKISTATAFFWRVIASA